MQRFIFIRILGQPRHRILEVFGALFPFHVQQKRLGLKAFIFILSVPFVLTPLLSTHAPSPMIFISPAFCVLCYFSFGRLLLFSSRNRLHSLPFRNGQVCVFFVCVCSISSLAPSGAMELFSDAYSPWLRYGEGNEAEFKRITFQLVDLSLATQSLQENQDLSKKFSDEVNKKSKEEEAQKIS